MSMSNPFDQVFLGYEIECDRQVTADQLMAATSGLPGKLSQQRPARNSAGTWYTIILYTDETPNDPPVLRQSLQDLLTRELGALGSVTVNCAPVSYS